MTILYAVSSPTISKIWNGPAGAPVAKIQVLSIVSWSATSFASNAWPAFKNGTKSEFKI